MSQLDRHVIRMFFNGVTKTEYSLCQDFIDDESIGYVILRLGSHGGLRVEHSFPNGRFPDASDRFKAIIVPML